MNQPLVYIVILNWNGFKDTIECIDSLLKIQYENYKIIIVDNNSSDDSAIVLKSKFPKIKLIKNTSNLGFSGGCNVGIKSALHDKADYVLLLNNDTIADKNFITELINIGESNKKIGVLSPFIFHYSKPNTIWSSGMNFDTSLGFPFIDSNKSKVDMGSLNKIRKIEFLTGCSMLIKKHVFKEIGFLREEYFFYFEDMDFCARATNSGFVLYSVPSSKVWHKIGQSIKRTNKANARIRYYFSRNIILFFNYNYPKRRLLNYYPFYLKECLYQSYLALKIRDYDAIRAIINGIIDGLRGKTGFHNI